MSSSPTIDAYATGPVATGPDRVRSAIASAAAETGNSFDFLLAQARIESRLNPTARAGTSSARGLYQFTEGSWLKAIERHGGEHGLGAAQAALRNPAQRAAILALRNDPQASALMAGELANDNRATLTAHLGRNPDHAELYLAHFLGADGANRFLDTLSASPQASAASLLPQAAAANRGIFYDGSGAPRSVAAVMQVIRTRFDSALTAPDSASDGIGGWTDAAGDGLPGLPAFASAAFPGAGSLDPQDAAAIAASSRAAPGGPIAQEFAAAAAAPQRASMADTLRGAFGLGGAGNAAPDHVQAAYGQLARFGF